MKKTKKTLKELQDTIVTNVKKHREHLPDEFKQLMSMIINKDYTPSRARKLAKKLCDKCSIQLQSERKCNACVLILRSMVHIKKHFGDEEAKTIAQRLNIPYLP